MRVAGGLSKIVAATCLVFCGVIGCSSVAFAAEEETPDYRIQVSPAKIELDLKPGETTTKKFRVQNTGSKDFDFELDTGPYSVEGEEYKQNLTNVTEYNNIKDWITFSKSEGMVPAGGSEEIEATVKVPKDVPAGGQYAVILAKMIEPQDTTSSGIIAEKQIGLLVYAKNVDGNTRETGNIVEAKVPSFMFAPPIKATSVVENTGNVHADATYIMQVYPLFGDEEVYTNEENPEKRTILPETRRLNTLTWDGAPQLGIFKVKQTVKFLDEVKEIEKVVFICPIWFLLIILVLIFLAVFWIVSRTRGRKE